MHQELISWRKYLSSVRSKLIPRNGNGRSTETSETVKRIKQKYIRPFDQINFQTSPTEKANSSFDIQRDSRVAF